jgi:hypothetical protein
VNDEESYDHLKVKLSINDLTKHHTIQTYEGLEVYLYAFLISALEGDKWLASRPGRFDVEVRNPWAI